MRGREPQLFPPTLPVPTPGAPPSDPEKTARFPAPLNRGGGGGQPGTGTGTVTVTGECCRTCHPLGVWMAPQVELGALDGGGA